MQPIVDYTGLIGYNLSRSIADLLVPIVDKTKYHTKNSEELSTQVKNLKIDKQDILNSHDVVSLFTNTPIKESLDIMKDKLLKDNTEPSSQLRTLLNCLSLY